jgi:micrococcal nuclease
LSVAGASLPNVSRQAAISLVVSAALISGGCSHARGPLARGFVPVLKVTDGDTIHVLYQGEDERVRLIGVDTPEVDCYGGQTECFGAQAGEFARRRLSDRSVRLRFDVELRDRFKRLLAYVYVGNELFNLTLIRLGYARADPVLPDVQMAGRFAAAEREARASGRGLWSACPS